MREVSERWNYQFGEDSSREEHIMESVSGASILLCLSEESASAVAAIALFFVRAFGFASSLAR